jgi:hypothetical protein
MCSQAPAFGYGEESGEVSIKTLLAVGAIALGTTATFTLTTGTAIAAPYTTGATVGVSNSNPDAGTAITVTLTGFQANEAVSGDLLSRKIHVFDVTADGAGSATAAFTIPAHFECGDHVILARGAQGDTAFADITVGGDCTPVGRVAASVRATATAATGTRVRATAQVVTGMSATATATTTGTASGCVAGAISTWT